MCLSDCLVQGFSALSSTAIYRLLYVAYMDGVTSKAELKIESFELIRWVDVIWYGRCADESLWVDEMIAYFEAHLRESATTELDNSLKLNLICQLR